MTCEIRSLILKFNSKISSPEYPELFEFEELQFCSRSMISAIRLESQSVLDFKLESNLSSTVTDVSGVFPITWKGHVKS